LSLSVVPKIECIESRDNFGRFKAEPLEKGFGVTLGNALRRVMLGHLKGAAITHVKIEGVQHEFYSIPNFREDMIEFLLNVKEIRLRSVTGRTGKLTLDVEGEGQIFAADIKTSADFEIVNPELYLGTLDSKDARLYVEFDVEIGSGFMEAESGDNLAVGVIPIDALFTPTRKVNYTVEPIHIGRETSSERLYLEVWTDRTITPIEAVGGSASMLSELFTAFVDFDQIIEEEPEEEVVGLSISEEQYNMPVEQLNLSVRTMNCLRRGNISTVGELISKGEKGLLGLRNFGQKSKQEIDERLEEIGLSLNPQEDSDDEAGDIEAVAETETGSVETEEQAETDVKQNEEIDQQ